MKPIQVIYIIAAFVVAGLTSCNERSCENTMCENGGICVDGSCDCPDGYTGKYCHERMTPNTIRITDMAVTRFPGLKEGTSWDALDGPDIYYQMYDGSRLIAQPDLLFENADAMQEYYFYFAFIDMENVTSTYTIRLLDFDGINTKDDFMGEIKFVPFDPTKGTPETIVIDDGGPIAFVMNVKYLYEKEKI